mmetsp:Transcript_84932/g.225032  ORF Transcript_84932/g.225032 Transcript_84932/m.225032 type:complete len:516 (+) Transcript_84932:910-2457(+)
MLHRQAHDGQAGRHSCHRDEAVPVEGTRACHFLQEVRHLRELGRPHLRRGHASPRVTLRSHREKREPRACNGQDDANIITGEHHRRQNGREGGKRHGRAGAQPVLLAAAHRHAHLVHVPPHALHRALRGRRAVLGLRRVLLPDPEERHDGSWPRPGPEASGPALQQPPPAPAPPPLLVAHEEVAAHVALGRGPVAPRLRHGGGVGGAAAAPGRGHPGLERLDVLALALRELRVALGLVAELQRPGADAEADGREDHADRPHGAHEGRGQQGVDDRGRAAKGQGAGGAGRLLRPRVGAREYPLGAGDVELPAGEIRGCRGQDEHSAKRDGRAGNRQALQQASWCQQRQRGTDRQPAFAAVQDVRRQARAIHMVYGGRDVLTHPPLSLNSRCVGRNRGHEGRGAESVHQQRLVTDEADAGCYRSCHPDRDARRQGCQRHGGERQPGRGPCQPLLQFRRLALRLAHCSLGVALLQDRLKRQRARREGGGELHPNLRGQQRRREAEGRDRDGGAERRLR